MVNCREYPALPYKKEPFMSDQSITTADDEDRQARKAAARVFYESNPKATVPDVAKQFDLSIGSIRRWSAEERWRAVEVKTLTSLPKRSVAIVKRAMKFNGGELDDGQLRALAMLAHHKERNRVASILSRDLRLTLNKLINQRNIPGPASMEEVKKLALIADAQKKISSELRQIWRLDDGVTPMIDDGIGAAIDAAEVKRQAISALPDMKPADKLY
jgi:hypothetical protein